MLARLNHPNIVSYKAAWLEPLDDKKRKAQIQNFSHSSSSQEASASILSLNSVSKSVYQDDLLEVHTGSFVHVCICHGYLSFRLPLPPAPKDNSEDSIDIIFQDSSPENRNSGGKSPKSMKNLREQVPKHSNKTQCTTDSLGTSILPGKSTSTESSPQSFSTETNSSRSSAEAVVCPMKARDTKRPSSSSTIFVSNCH